MAKKSTYYRIGLGEPMLQRASFIFLIILILTITATGSAIYAGYKNGDLEKTFVKPVKDFTAAIGKALEESDQASPERNSVSTFTATSSSEINIEINNGKVSVTNIPVKNGTTNYRPANPPVTPTPIPAGKSYEQSVQEMNARANAAYQEALKKQSEWAAEQKAASDQRMKDLQTQSQAELEAWKKANGF